MIVKYRTPLIDLLIFIDTNGNMAQLVEQLTFNQWVTGSSPVRVIYAGVAELADAPDLGSGA